MTTDHLFADELRGAEPFDMSAPDGGPTQAGLDEHFPWHRIRRLSRK